MLSRCSLVLPRCSFVFPLSHFLVSCGLLWLLRACKFKRGRLFSLNWMLVKRLYIWLYRPSTIVFSSFALSFFPFISFTYNDSSVYLLFYHSRSYCISTLNKAHSVSPRSVRLICCCDLGFVFPLAFTSFQMTKTSGLLRNQPILAPSSNSKSLIALARFAQVKADLARMQLANRDFEIAKENATAALDLLADEEENNSYRKVRLSAYMTAGLAFYYQGSITQFIDMFKTALLETHGNLDIICFLAQIL